MRLVPITTEELFEKCLNDIKEKKQRAAILITLDGGRTSMPLLKLLTEETMKINYPIYHIHVSPDNGIPDRVVEEFHPDDLPLLVLYEDGDEVYQTIGEFQSYALLHTAIMNLDMGLIMMR